MMQENLEMLSKIQKLRNSFSQKFDPVWKTFIHETYTDFADAAQLNIGNHTRPFLVIWGYFIDKEINAVHISDEIIQLAVDVEAIHKASVIIDDIIDGDTLRRGKKCMHIEYGEYETVFFAVCMLSKAIKNANQILDQHPNRQLHSKSIELLCDTIYAMCKGAIREITATPNQQIQLENVKEIIDSETAQLIKNSLLMGYLYTGTENKYVEKIIHIIGRKCGYIFQVMNDLEAFCDPAYISGYKGNINSDLLKSRKSIVLPILYQQCNKEEKAFLMEAVSQQASDFLDIKNLFDHYDIKTIIQKDIETTYASIRKELNELRDLIDNQPWISAFQIFLNNIKKKYLSVLK
ncbi:MAG: polyprenyl synthetase family protein [Lachnospiraceae bacterium]|nr:polyprenyl synthetase family protein [Lachnospiraceae bacterium]